MIKYAGAEFSISPANRKQMPTAVPNKKHKKSILTKYTVCGFLKNQAFAKTILKINK